VRLSFQGKGLRYGGVEANEVVRDYVERKRLAKLGIVVNVETLPAVTVDRFLEIDRYLDELEEEERKKEALKNKVKRGR
jgi:hypothetical protein